MNGRPLATPITTSAATDEFHALYRANYGFVWHTVRRFGVDDAGVDDALQETFLTAYRRRDRWHGGSPKSWLYAIARRVASNHRRSHQRRLQRDGAWELAASDRVDDPRTFDALHVVDRFMRELSDRDREVFVLSELEGLGGAEVADVLAIPASTAYDRIRNVREQFARHVQERDGLLARARAQRPRATARAWAVLLARLPEAPAPAPWWAASWSTTKLAIASAVAAGAIVVASAGRSGDAATSPAATLPEVAATISTPHRDGEASPAVAELPTQDVAAVAIAAASPAPVAPSASPAAERTASTSARRVPPPRAGSSRASVEPAAAAPRTGEHTEWLTDAALRLRSGDAAAALALTDRHAADFPGSPLADVRLELRIESLCALGRGTQGRDEAAAWIRRAPRSPFAARAAAACESAP
ncbi:MAG: sigma-70 family RNA polymerase sigma factor [Nannocystaceae bacterium]|nr:sigma-70 family RNA polymerase sigma factor [Nannocystaceae bacterium]